MVIDYEQWGFIYKIEAIPDSKYKLSFQGHYDDFTGLLNARYKT